MDIIIADPLCEPGHVPTTSYFLSETKKVYNVYFISNKTYAKSIGHKSETTTIHNPKPYRGLRFILVNLMILWKISTLSKKISPNAPIVLLSYETISFTICRLLFSNLKNSYIFNHNNIDQLEKSYMRRLAFSTLCVPTKHLVYEPFIKDHLSLNSKFNVLFVSHPMIFNWMPQPTDEQINVFVPHMLDYAQFNGLNQFAKYGKHFNIRAKFEESISTSNITTMPFFPNFEEELRLSNIVIVFGTYNFRSSGIAYAAISSGRILIIRSSLFSTNLALNFPKQVFLFTDMSSLFILLNKFKSDRNYFNLKSMDKEVSKLEGVISN